MKRILNQLTAVLCLLMTTAALSAQTVEESQVTILQSITSTGAQAFNTGYTHKANSRVVMDCNVMKNSMHTWEALFGARLTDYQYNAFCFFSRHCHNVDSPLDDPCFNRTGYETNGTGFVYGERIILECEGKQATWYRYSDPNTAVGWVNTDGDADDGKTPMLFFSLNTSETQGGVTIDASPSVMTLYGCQIYEGSTLVCDFVPAKYNGTVGLYDRERKTFSGSITGIPFEESTDKRVNYERALSTIVDGQTYRVFTMYGGQKYYVTADGSLSTNVNDAPLFSFNKVRGQDYEFGFMLQNGFTYFTNPVGDDDAALTKGHLNTTNENSRHTWEAQVLFLNSDGKYAIRSTNAISGTTGLNRIGRAFWTVNAGANGPLAEYSFDTNYVWQLEMGASSLPTPNQELLTNGKCNGTFNGWKKTNGGSGWDVRTVSGYSFWISSYELCTLSQTVTLATYDISAESIDNGEVWCSASAEMKSSSENNGNGASTCRVTIIMLDANDQSLGTVTVLNDNTYVPEWDSFRTAPFLLVSGTRKLTYLVEGEDARGWLGQYGPCFRNLSLKALVEVDDSEAYPVWLGSKRVTARNMNDIFGDGKVSYTPGEGTGTLTFTTSTPTINGAHSWSAVSGGSEYSFAATIYAEGIDLTINAPTNLTLAAGTDEDSYAIYVANEGDLDINANFNVTTGANALSLDKGNLTVNGNFNSTTLERGIFVREGDVNITGDVYIKTTGNMTTSLVVSNGYLYIGPGNWEIESNLNTVYATKKADNGSILGSIVIPYTHKITLPEGGRLSDDNRAVMTADGQNAQHVKIQKRGNPTIIDLSKLTGDCVAQDNTLIIGTLSKVYKVSIADGAFVLLRDATINIVPEVYDETWDGVYRWAGITCLGNATIALEGENTVKGFCNEYPGIYVPESKTLTIDGSASLHALSGRQIGPEGEVVTYGAGIGGGAMMSGGNVVILGGNITATGGAGTPGIGSGVGYGTTEASFGDITIKGGVVRANGIGSGAGIGIKSICGNITICDGDVTSTGGLYVPGIGSGFYEESRGESICGDIKIWGGKVTATGGEGAAGIGSGSGRSTCGAITINGGVVTATGGKEAAGIGSGRFLSTCGVITINDGDVTATAGEGGAGIGSGYAYNTNSTCGLINLNGGIVTATAGEGGAGIGSGYGYNKESTCEDVIIRGGVIRATGSSGAGIGSGYADQGRSACGDIFIIGGVVNATGGESSAGIGSGHKNPDVPESNPKDELQIESVCGDICIDRGMVKVTATAGGADASTPIGAGYNSICGTVTIENGITDVIEGLTRTLFGALFGDANTDDNVNIADVMAIVNYILGSEPTRFMIDAADMNNDQKITIADAAILVSRLLSSGTN